MTQSNAEENYLKVIFKLSQKDKNGVSTTSIADKMDTKASSVTEMIKKLAEKGLVNYKKYQGVRLTKNGEKVAIKTIRKHRLWEDFLLEHLEFKWDEVHDIAEELEHIKSDKLVDKLDQFLNYPKYGPHGDPIPDKEGKFPAMTSMSISELEVGDKGIVIAINDENSDFLKYLDSINIQLSTEIEVLDFFSFDKSFEVIIDGKKNHLSSKAAENILIKKIE